MIPEEEARAASYREQLARRAASRRALHARLSGSKEAAAEVLRDWLPIIEHLREKRQDAALRADP